MKASSLFLSVFLSVLCADGSTFSGTLKNKFGFGIPIVQLTATKSDTGEQVSFYSGSQGEFSVQLSAGTWTITGDAAKIDLRGFAPLENYEVLIPFAGTTQDIVLFAKEPLIPPRIEIWSYDLQQNSLRLHIEYQGGTRITAYRSDDFQEWTPVYSSAHLSGASGGVFFSIPNDFALHPKSFFKVVATTEEEHAD
jgi:hypothetical protein